MQIGYVGSHADYSERLRHAIWYSESEYEQFALLALLERAESTSCASEESELSAAQLSCVTDFIEPLESEESTGSSEGSSDDDGGGSTGDDDYTGPIHAGGTECEGARPPKSPVGVGLGVATATGRGAGQVESVSKPPATRPVPPESGANPAQLLKRNSDVNESAAVQVMARGAAPSSVAGSQDSARSHNSVLQRFKSHPVGDAPPGGWGGDINAQEWGWVSDECVATNDNGDGSAWPWVPSTSYMGGDAHDSLQWSGEGVY